MDSVETRKGAFNNAQNEATPIEGILSIQANDNLLLVGDMQETYEIAQTHT
jgi:hypothetical protein